MYLIRMPKQESFFEATKVLLNSFTFTDNSTVYIQFVVLLSKTV